MVRTFKTSLSILALALFFPSLVYAASLSISPPNETLEVGDRVTVKVMVSGSESINAVSGEVSIPTNLFSIESVSKFGSVLNFWVSEPTFSNSSGRVNFEGVALGGFQGGSGSVVTISLRAKAVGEGKISFVSGQVLANDGQGTNVTQSLSAGNFAVKEATQVKNVEKTEEVHSVFTPASLKSPEIMLVSRYGERAISGNSAYPNSEAVITFINDEGVKIFVQSKTDENGHFEILVPKTLKRDIYRASAQVIQKDLTYSPPSNTIKVRVGNIISDLGWDVWAIFVFLLLLLVYLSVKIYNYFKKDKEIRLEAHEAREVLKKSFKLLHEDLSEKQSAKEIIQDLDDAETLINKELKDIEKL